MIAAVDEGGDGEIGMDEFLQLMADQMMAQEQDEELIAAFKLFGADDINGQITLENLEAAIKQYEGEEFTQEELTIIFDEIAGASKKPQMRNPRLKNQHSSLDDEILPRGISFTDFMLMMMAK